MLIKLDRAYVNRLFFYGKNEVIIKNRLSNYLKFLVIILLLLISLYNENMCTSKAGVLSKNSFLFAISLFRFGGNIILKSDKNLVTHYYFDKFFI